VLARVRRAAWRLKQAEKERDWTLTSAPTRVHQLAKDASADVVEAVLAGWSAPEGTEDQFLRQERFRTQAYPASNRIPTPTV
jgi:hypothetical protein